MHLDSKTFVIIAGNPKSINVRDYKRNYNVNIATTDWLRRALGSDQPLTELIKFTPNDIIHATEELKAQFEAEAPQVDQNSETPPMNYEDLAQSHGQINANVSNDYLLKF